MYKYYEKPYVFVDVAPWLKNKPKMEPIIQYTAEEKKAYAIAKKVERKNKKIVDK